MSKNITIKAKKFLSSLGSFEVRGNERKPTHGRICISALPGLEDTEIQVIFNCIKTGG